MEKNRSFYILIVGIVAGASFWASSAPDGLGFVAQKLGFLGPSVQHSAPLTAYVVPGLGADPLSTILSGLIGIGLCAGVVGLYTFIRSSSLKKQ
ncbi:MAG: PDGLE domain-containing protein [Candidatus Margulisiibacteriota bacterium]|jgi:hypothetical protein